MGKKKFIKISLKKKKRVNLNWIESKNLVDYSLSFPFNENITAMPILNFEFLI